MHCSHKILRCTDSHTIPPNAHTHTHTQYLPTHTHTHTAVLPAQGSDCIQPTIPHASQPCVLPFGPAFRQLWGESVVCPPSLWDSQDSLQESRLGHEVSDQLAHYTSSFISIGLFGGGGVTWSFMFSPPFAVPLLSYGSLVS